MCVLYFFVLKQQTAYEVRIRDWSSYVFSSDLGPPRQEGDVGPQVLPRLRARQARHERRRLSPRQEYPQGDGLFGLLRQAAADQRSRGRAHPQHQGSSRRSAESSVGTECVSTWRSRWEAANSTKKTNKK